LLTIPSFTSNDPENDPENVPEALISERIPPKISAEPDNDPENVPEAIRSVNTPVPVSILTLPVKAPAEDGIFRLPLIVTNEPAEDERIR